MKYTNKLIQFSGADINDILSKVLTTHIVFISRSYPISDNWIDISIEFLTRCNGQKAYEISLYYSGTCSCRQLHIIGIGC